MKRPNSTGVWEGRQSLSKLELDLNRYCDLCSDEVGHENLACESECNVGKEVGARPQREPANINKDPHNSISFPILHSLLSQCLITTRVRIHGRHHCDDREAWV